MDAMQKKQVTKVALVHFGLTLLFFVLWIARECSSYKSPDGIVYVGVLGWLSKFIVVSLAVLQPVSNFLLWAVEKINWFSVFPENFSARILGLMSSTIIACLFFVSMVWSICFGWIYVKSVSWLNHFPVLGRKVF
jgi:hypothetical protein